MSNDDNKWSRERSFWERNGPDIGIITVSVIFLGLAVMGAGFVLFKPEVPGLSTLFKAPPPPKPDPYAQKMTLQPGEQEVFLFKRPANPAAKPEAPPAKP